MSRLIDHVAEITGARDRDIVDVSLANALGELLHPRSVAVHRAVGEAGDQRWMTRARLHQGDAVATSDPVWSAMEDLPLLGDFPLRRAALSAQEIVCGEPGTNLSIFPLLAESRAVGVVELFTHSPLDEASRNTVTSILQIFHNFQSLLDYSERDTLTGLLNRKTFDDSFFKLMQPTFALKASADRRREDADHHFWLAMVDIDFFKSVNDTHGHLIGDEVLLLLSRLMRKTLRFHDRLYRFGGEEFVIVMRCSDEFDAAAALERLRRNTETYAFPQVGRLTISVGFTAILPTDSPTTALERADRAVYHAKSHGRNQVRSHAALVSEGHLLETENVGDIELF